jgi:diguanylate cyclase (GGDEF)-like protein
MKTRLFRPVDRFPGEFFALSLVVVLGTMLLFGTPAALLTTSVLGLIQVLALRRMRLGQRRAVAELGVARAMEQKWHERADTFMHELACFKDEVAYQDPETGVGNPRQFELEWERQIARCQRRGEPFSVAVVRVLGAGEGGELLESAALVAAAHRLAQTTRTEDCLCRVARQGFAVLLAGSAVWGAQAYVERARERFAATPIAVGDRMVEVSVRGGAAEYAPAMASVEELLAAAVENMRNPRVNAETRPGSFGRLRGQVEARAS